MVVEEPPFLNIDGVATRLLEDRERPYGTVEAGVPLVLEPKGARSVVELKAFLAARSAEVMAAVYRHGAILFRGFEVSSERDFEETMRSIRGLRPMNGYFMSERGRDLVDEASSVLYTNKYARLGANPFGSVKIGGFHSENYFSADVPALQAFWCKTAPWMGAETAMVHMANAYDELSGDLRAKLEAEPFCSMFWSVPMIARRYRLPEDRVEQFFRDLGLLVVLVDGRKEIVFYKPNVYRHPHVPKRSLQVNLSMSLRDLDPALRRLFTPAYEGGKWALYRAAWRQWDTMTAFRLAVKGRRAELGSLVKVTGQRLLGAQPRGRAPAESTLVAPPGTPPIVRIGARVTRDEVGALAAAVRKHCSLFSWRRGDILFFDNLQMLHAAMPGVGPRVIRVMIFNPLPLKYPLTSGLTDVAPEEGYRSIDERLRALQRTLS
jgi:alpha-ketoglutarate-dependent taurine dioxygenase